MTIADGCWTGTQWHEDATQRDGPSALSLEEMEALPPKRRSLFRRASNLRSWRDDV